MAKKKKKPLIFLPVDDKKGKSIKIPKTDFEYKIFKLKELSASPLNPSFRTNKFKLKSLVKNLSVNGQNNPITVVKLKTTVDGKPKTVNRIVDGHRRCAALEQLGHDEVHGILLKNDAINYDEAFTSLHSSTLKINTVQECERWLKGAKSISNTTRNRITCLQTRLGKVRAKMIIQRCVDIGKSPGTIAMAINNYERYINEKLSSEGNFKVAYWMLNIGSSWKLSTAIGALIPVELLKECIKHQVEIPEDWAHRLGELV